MSEHINYINIIMDEVNNACSELYESFFEGEDEVLNSIDNLIELLNEIRDPYEKQ